MIPLFLHIPRCAGTYITGCLDAMHWLVFRNKINGREQRIRVTDQGRVVLTVWVKDFPEFKEISLPSFLHRYSASNIFAYMIESEGFYLIKNDFFDFGKICPFSVFRNPLERAVSLYKYLSSEKSSHEPTYGAMRFDNFEDYVLSEQFEDAWVIRALLSIPSRQICDADFHAACNILDKFKIQDISEVDVFFDSIMLQAYNIKLSDVPWRKILKNETGFQNIQVGAAANDVFSKKTFYDCKLYSRYCGKAC